MLQDKILRKESGLLFYGLTPPKSNNDKEKIQAIADKQIERIKNIEIDGLILYDIQDESSRIDIPRPFPYVSTLSPDEYSTEYLSELTIPRIIYKSVGKYTSDEFREMLSSNEQALRYMVFVGSPSRNHMPALSLNEAYQIRKELQSQILLGGVTIPERHFAKNNEHLRLFDKIDNGCNFFVSQCVYNVDHAKNLLSDYYYMAQETERELAPVIFTFTPCGSLKTLEFMQWLGIDIPKWLHNDLKHSNDILMRSIDNCRKIAGDLLQYSREKKIPIGFNIESVAIRKDEIEASIELLKDIKKMLL